MNLGKNVKITSALDYTDASADRNGTILDMQGYDGVVAIVKTAVIAAGAVTSYKWQSGAQSNMGDAADLAGTGLSVADDDDNQVFVLELHKPAERYVRLVADKDAANNVAESAVYIQYSGSKFPIDNNVANAVTYELNISPAEGTA